MICTQLLHRELCTSTISRQHPSHDSSLSCVQVGLLNKDKVSHLHSLCVQMTVLCKVSVSLPCKKTSPGPGPGEALAWDEAPGGCSTCWFGWYWEFICPAHRPLIPPPGVTALCALGASCSTAWLCGTAGIWCATPIACSHTRWC